MKNSAQLVRLPGSRANHTQPYPGLRVPRPFSPLRAELPAWAKDVEVLYLVHDGRCPLIIPFNGEGTVAQLETNQTHYSALPSLQLQSLQQSSQRCLEFLKNLPARKFITSTRSAGAHGTLIRGIHRYSASLRRLVHSPSER